MFCYYYILPDLLKKISIQNITISNKLRTIFIAYHGNFAQNLHRKFMKL